MTALSLGLRLALTGAGRLRSLALVLATTIAVVLALGTAAACRAMLLRASDVADDQRLALACVAAIAIPCAVLVVTVARLSAALRDRRLAGLRLIGLSPAQTRTVAAAETGVGAVAGTLIGYAVFWLLRPALAHIHLAGLDWHDHFAPHAIDSVLALVVPPLLAVAAAVLPQRTRPDEALASARRAERRPPRLWRIVPLALGVAICVGVQVRAPQSSAVNNDAAIPWLFAGITLLGVGILLVVPVFVRLFAALLIRLPSSPPVRLAARRMQAQPAGVARIVSVLLLGLFVVTGARYVLVAWEAQPYYRYAVEALHQRQLVTMPTTLGRAAALEARARQVTGVTDVLALPELRGPRGATAVVADCAEVARMEVPLGGCRDGQAYDLDRWNANPRNWTAGRGAQRVEIASPAHVATPPNGATSGLFTVPRPLDQSEVLLPPSAVGTLPPTTDAQLVVTAAPGRWLGTRLEAAGLPYADGYDFTDYDFVRQLRLLVWCVAGVILAVGLLTFGIAGVDRAVQRRKQVTALRLVGIGAGTLQRSQWVEASLPIGVGAALAVALGALAGLTYLRWGGLDSDVPLPWGATWLLAGLAVLGAIAAGAATVLASSPRIRPDEIRTE